MTNDRGDGGRGEERGALGEREELETAIAALDTQRALLGDAVVEAALSSMRDRLATLQSSPPATLQSLPPEEQRKLLTVLFADVSGFTAMAETRDAEDVRELMNRLWARLDGVLVAHGGHIDKHIGDAVMALFGTPTGCEDDPERAVRAALALQQALADESAPWMGARRLIRRCGCGWVSARGRCWSARSAPWARSPRWATR